MSRRGLPAVPHPGTESLLAGYGSAFVGSLSAGGEPEKALTDHEPHTPAVQKRVQLGVFFPDLPAEELDELAAVTIELELDAGTGITKLNDYATTLYCIQEGEADVVIDSGETHPSLSAPSDTFGEIALLLTGQRTATVTARTPMKTPLALGPGTRSGSGVHVCPALEHGAAKAQPRTSRPPGLLEPDFRLGKTL